MRRMSNEDPNVRAYIALPASTWKAIAEYRARVGAVSLADAVRRLLLAGLRAERRAER